MAPSSRLRQHGMATGALNTLQRVRQHLTRREPTAPGGKKNLFLPATVETIPLNATCSTIINSEKRVAMSSAIAGNAPPSAPPLSAADDPVLTSTGRRSSAGDASTELQSVVVSNRLANKKKFSAVLPTSPTTTPSKKSPSAKKITTAEDYHRTLLSNRNVIVPLVPDKLYLARLPDVPVPRVSEVAVFFSTDDEYVYENFFDDFGPLNIGNVYRYCKKLEKKLNFPGNSNRKIIHVGWAADRRLFANVAWLTGAFCIVVEKLAPELVYERVSSMLGPEMQSFPPFRDAATGPSTYDLTLLDCYKALDKAIRCGFFDYNTFNITEYEHYEKVENGDFNWITSKFLAFCGPSATSRLDNGYPLHAPDVYFSYFRRNNVTTIIRLNAPLYPAKRFTDAGFEHFDLIYPDGTSPPMPILQRFLRICENAKGAIAVHCKAGLGRTGTLIGAYLLKHFRWTTAEVIAWLRIARPGSVIGQQQQFLEDVKEILWKQGEIYRQQQQAAAATQAATLASGGDAETVAVTTTTVESNKPKMEQNQNDDADKAKLEVPDTDAATAQTTVQKPASWLTPPGGNKQTTSSDVVNETNVGTPGKEWRARRQLATSLFEQQEPTSTSSAAERVQPPKGRQSIRQTNKPAVTQLHPLDNGTVAAGGKKENGETVAQTVDDESALTSTSRVPMLSRAASRRVQQQGEQRAVRPVLAKTASEQDVDTLFAGHVMRSSNAAPGDSSKKLLDDATGLTSNKRKRSLAGNSADKRNLTTNLHSEKKAEAVAVTEEDIESLILDEETAVELAAVEESKRHQPSKSRNKQQLPTKNARRENSEAVQPTTTTAAEVESTVAEKNADATPSEEERHERLMDLFRANKLDKAVTVADEEQQVCTGTEEGGDLNHDAAAAAAQQHHHLVSDTKHLTQGDRLNMAKAMRSVRPFGFGPGAGHGTPSAAVAARWRFD